MKKNPARSLLLATAALLCATSVVAQSQGAGAAGVLSFAHASYNFSEEDGIVSIEVRRHKGTAGAVSVEWEAAPGTATAADFVPASGVLEWGDGDGANQSFEVELLDDLDIEGLETVFLTLRNPTDGAVLFPPMQAVLRIRPSEQPEDGDDGEEDEGEEDEEEGEEEEEGEDDEEEDLDIPAQGLIRFDQRTYQVRESVGIAVITVRRTGGSTGEVSVDFSTADSSAVAPDDYQATAGTLAFGDGEEGLATFTVPIVDDAVKEATERIALRLEAVTGGALLHPDHDVATLLVLDNDSNGHSDRSEGVITFAEAEFQVVESEGLATITVERRFGNRGAVQVSYEVTEGSATDGEDFQAVVGTLVWARGDDMPKTFTVPILPDDLEEGSETVQLRLFDLQGAAELAEGGDQATLQILDDDSSLTTCVPDGATLCFQSGRFQATVVWRAANGSSGDGNAAALSDQSGVFWFFDQGNAEMLIKLLDACSVAGLEGFWFFVAATTDLDFTLKVTDTATGLSKEYSNLLGQPAAPVLDALTFRTCSG